MKGNRERRRNEEALRQSEKRHRSLFENMHEGFAYCRMLFEDGVPQDFTYLNVNAAFEHLTGLKDVIGKKVSEVIPGIRKSDPELFEIYGRVALTGLPERFEIYVEALGIWFAISAYCPEKEHFVAVFDNVTDRKRTEEARDATIGLLDLCNKAGSLLELMRELMIYFQRLTGCAAVGVRLKEGEDYPYYETRGFPEEFVQAENSLCAYDQKGELIRDSAGHPALDCMCGNILCGRYDPAKPFFSSRGSFWSNCTSELLASTTDADRQAKTRNRCNGEGYESVALVPLRSRGEIFGLFQFNDRHSGRFTAEKIALLEDLVSYVAIALSKLKVDEALREASQYSRQIIHSAGEGLVVHGPDLRFQVWNPFMEAVSGLSAEEVMGRYPLEVFPYLRDNGIVERLESVLAGQLPPPSTSPIIFPAAAAPAGSRTRKPHCVTPKGKLSELLPRYATSPNGGRMSKGSSTSTGCCAHCALSIS